MLILLWVYILAGHARHAQTFSVAADQNEGSAEQLANPATTQEQTRSFHICYYYISNNQIAPDVLEQH